MVDRQNLLERRLLVTILARGAVRLGKVHPQYWLGRIVSGCGRKMTDRQLDVAGFQGVEPQLVQTIRIASGQGLSAQ